MKTKKMETLKTTIKWGAACLLLMQVTSCSETGSSSPQNTTTEVSNNTSTESSSTENAENSKGVGPVQSVTLGEIDNNLASKGKEIFEAKCTACHEIDKKKVGPAIKGVTQRRTPEWIMNMILNPTEMTQKDPVAKELLGTYAAPMANQNLTQDEARAVLEYFRTLDK